MATGDQADIVFRLKAALPNGWFQDATPILDAVLNGIAWPLARIYSLTNYARQQTRVATATDGFLDLISFDFFGALLPRFLQESDSAFVTRIKAQLFLERATRHGLIRALQILTGRTPLVFEPANPFDTSGWNQGTFAYNTAGGWGNLSLPYQAFVTAYRPNGQGIPNIAGWGNPQGALNTGSQAEYVNPDMIAGAITDASIYALIASVQPEGTIVWTRISS